MWYALLSSSLYKDFVASVTYTINTLLINHSPTENLFNCIS